MCPACHAGELVMRNTHSAGSIGDCLEYKGSDSTCCVENAHAMRRQLCGIALCGIARPGERGGGGLPGVLAHGSH